MNPALFSFLTAVRFHQADPAGILFFGHVGALAHDAYEAFVEHLGFSWREWFENPEWAVPIRKTSCEYLKPMRAGEELTIVVGIEKIGESSITLNYDFRCKGETHAEMQIVHVFLDKKARAKMPIPSVVRRKLEAYQSQGLGQHQLT